MQGTAHRYGENKRVAYPAPPRALLKRVFECTPWPLCGRGDLAVHEAGHLVVAGRLGMAVCGAAVNRSKGVAFVAGMHMPDQNPADVHIPETNEACDFYHAAFNLIWPGLDHQEAALRFVVMLCAGRQAEMMLSGLPLVGQLMMLDADHMQATYLLHSTGQRLALGWCQRQARHLLSANWAEMERIAATLRQKGEWRP